MTDTGGMSIWVAFFAGVASITSPCVIGLMPAYISYLTSDTLSLTTKTGNKDLVLKSILFVIGFTIIFMIFGASASLIGRIFIRNQIIICKIAGVIVFIFGLHMLGLLKFKLLMKDTRQFSGIRSSGYVRPIVIGMAFAGGWSPCIGPILGSILVYSSVSATLSTGLIFLSMYSLGMGIPFILMALSMEKIKPIIPLIRKYSHIVSLVSGIVLMVMGVRLFFYI